MHLLFGIDQINKLLKKSTIDSVDIKKSKAFIVGASGYIGSQLLDKSSNFFSSFGTTSSINSMGLLHLKLNDPLDLQDLV